MTTLGTLSNGSRGRQGIKRVGRGPGSGIGKTCGRGIKGAGARSGYKRRHGYEGGQMRLFQKLPTRGFTRGRFAERRESVNLDEIDRVYQEGEVVSLETLRQKGFIERRCAGVKILSRGSLTKKLGGFDSIAGSIAFSAAAKAKIEEAQVSIK